MTHADTLIAADGPPLRYDWWGAYTKLEERRDLPGSRWAQDHALACARWFIAEWADWAELVGMQPAHLMRYVPNGKVALAPYARGLAWRWAFGGFDIMAFIPQMLIADSESGNLFVYRFEPNGDVRPIFGTERKRIISTPFEELNKLPNRCRAYIEAQARWDAEDAAAFELMGASGVQPIDDREG